MNRVEECEYILIMEINKYIQKIKDHRLKPITCKYRSKVNKLRRFNKKATY